MVMVVKIKGKAIKIQKNNPIFIQHQFPVEITFYVAKYVFYIVEPSFYITHWLQILYTITFLRGNDLYLLFN